MFLFFSVGLVTRDNIVNVHKWRQSQNILYYVWVYNESTFAGKFHAYRAFVQNNPNHQNSRTQIYTCSELIANHFEGAKTLRRRRWRRPSLTRKPNSQPSSTTITANTTPTYKVVCQRVTYLRFLFHLCTQHSPFVCALCCWTVVLLVRVGLAPVAMRKYSCRLRRSVSDRTTTSPHDQDRLQFFAHLMCA